MAAAQPHFDRRSLWALGRAVLIALAGLLVLEFVFRGLEGVFGVDRARLQRAREFVGAGGASWYQPRPYFGWALAEGLRGENQLGFYGPEPALERKPAVPRVLCLGGSTTAGGNDWGHLGSYPHFLELALEAQLGCDVEVINGGISGWTSAEMLCAWFLLFQDYRPDLLVIHEAVNDSEPRMTPGFRRDYSHFRSVWSLRPAPAWLAQLVSHSDLCAWLFSLRGAPELREATVRPRTGPWAFDGVRLPPETLAPLKRNFNEIARSQLALGGRVLWVTLPPQPWVPGRARFEMQRAGIQEHNQLMRELAQATGTGLVDLEALAQAVDPVERAAWFLDLAHVRPEANRWKAERMAEFLAQHPEWRCCVAPLEK